MRTLEECKKWISKSASTTQEAKFCSGQDPEIDYHLEQAIAYLVTASRLVNANIKLRDDL